MGEIFDTFQTDHRRLESLLAASFVHPGAVDGDGYAAFRSGLLRHIALEEKILLPALLRNNHGTPHPSASRLRLDHGAFAALLVPSPDERIRRVFLAIMHDHNDAEEATGGIYSECDILAGGIISDLRRAMEAYPQVPVMPHSSAPYVYDALRRAVARAGYDFDRIAASDDSHQL